jgi:ATP-dependent helicase YprA (DUF1998 family)
MTAWWRTGRAASVDAGVCEYAPHGGAIVAISWASALVTRERRRASWVSLSRKLRLAAEKKLKEGEVRVLVATASLELGIDVGTVDLAMQISSPRAIAVALQRVGRSGHWRGATAEGTILRRPRATI